MVMRSCSLRDQRHRRRHLLPILLLYSSCIWVNEALVAAAFQEAFRPKIFHRSSCCRQRATTFSALSASKDPSGPLNLLDRFISPVIDDRGLPLSDVLVAQVIAPSLQVAWLSLNHAPSPTWIQPLYGAYRLYSTRGSFVAPTLIHGAALAVLWVLGALAARAYENEAIVPNKDNARAGYANVLWRVLKAGAFATGLLIVCTQLDLLIEFNGRLVQLGDSPETDARLLTGAVEIINDVVFEAVCLITLRLYVAVQFAQSSGDGE